MRVLVVGPYPPTTDPAAERTVELVRELAAAGDDVEVLSPRPGGAHHAADLQGLVGAAAVAKRASAYDRLVLCLEPSLFNRAWVSRPRRVLDRLALGAALRRWPEVVVHVDVDRFPGAAGAFPSRFLWQAVDRFVVPADRDRADLTGAGAVPDDRIVVAERERPVREPSDVGWRFDGAPSREEVMAAVRSRAAEERAAAEAGAWSDPPPWPSTTAPPPPPLRRWVPPRLLPYASVAKRTVKRLLPS